MPALQDEPLATESEVCRLLNVNPFRARKLRKSAILVPDQTVGRLRLYRRSQLDALAAAVAAK